MLFHTARFESRTDDAGQLVTLENQDRSTWDQGMIAEGMQSLRNATKGSFLNEYYVQAAIIGVHCDAKTYQSTEWESILELYDTLVKINPSPVVRLNRAVALAKAKSAENALNELSDLGRNEQMQSYYLFHAIRAELLSECKRKEEAVTALDMAISLTAHPKEIAYLQKKRDAVSTMG
jgi:RNA polymerase sigma-70 factor (ECF subfamily)